MDLAQMTCRVPGCGGPASGVCINNLSFVECPDVISTSEINGEEEQVVTPQLTEQTQSSAFVTVKGDSLDAEACDSLLRERGGVVIGIVAGPDVGKTTLISALYEHVSRGKISGVRFAGSETLRGYEERCHLSRLSSNAAKPDTLRTPTSAKLSFTHLRISSKESFYNLIFSDRSGEHFDNVLNRPPTISEFSELTRANIVLLLLDLKEFLMNPHEQISRMRRLVMAMYSADQLSEKVVLLVGTKADLMGSEAELNNATEALTKLAQSLSAKTPNITIAPLVMASRRGNGPASSGQGFDLLFESITSSSDRRSPILEDTWPPVPTELDLLMRPYRSQKA